ncbi:MAG: Septum site-determining protein DivIVA [Firmicutes bacterium ADurb.Bin193]|nr:MAG: Septum site-determining protein DivIVA [Firmicutes bacterium ADurb.Bin193]
MITPLDIQNKVFKKEFRGYSPTEVDEFLNLVIDSYEKLYREGIEARDKISSMQETLDHYKALEDTLKNTLVVAQSTGEKVQASAREMAELIISEAQLTAKKIINDGHEEVKKISYKYDEIKRSIDVYRARMTALLNSQLDLLSNISTSEKTLAELVGVKEALEEIEKQAFTGDIPEIKADSENTTQPETIPEPVDTEEKPEPAGEASKADVSTNTDIYELVSGDEDEEDDKDTDEYSAATENSSAATEEE